MRSLRTFDEAVALARVRLLQAPFGVGVACLAEVTNVQDDGLMEDGTRVLCVLTDGERELIAPAFFFRARFELMTGVVEDEVEKQAGRFPGATRLRDLTGALREDRLDLEHVWLEGRAA
jgi:hypothetical protein